jgi:hypothetical protein
VLSNKKAKALLKQLQVINGLLSEMVESSSAPPIATHNCAALDLIIRCVAAHNLIDYPDAQMGLMRLMTYVHAPPPAPVPPATAAAAGGLLLLLLLLLLVLLLLQYHLLLLLLLLL